jgi:hypothetical protein
MRNRFELSIERARETICWPAERKRLILSDSYLVRLIFSSNWH